MLSLPKKPLDETTLPLTAFERYLLADDHPDYPMAFVMQLTLSGKLDRLLFEASLHDTVKRHPLLAAVHSHNDDHIAWDCSEVRYPSLDWDAWNVALRPDAIGQIDLTIDSGLRIWVRCDSERAELTMQFHHACCDGVGALQFISDLFVTYGRRFDGLSLPSESDRGGGNLAQRGDPRLLRRHARRSATFAARTCYHTIKNFVLQRPTKLAAPASRSANVDAGRLPGVVAHRFDEAVSRELRAAANALEVPLNTLLASSLFEAISKWNVDHGKDRKDWLRVLIPVNQRTHHHRSLSACNIVSYLLLNRRGSHCLTRPAMLSGLRHDLELRRCFDLGSMFLAGLSLADQLGLIGRYLSSDHCLATVIFTNLGDISRRLSSAFGRRSGKLITSALALEEFQGTSPVRPGTRAAFAVFECQSRITVCLRTDPAYFGRQDAEELLARYIERLSIVT